MSKQKSYTKEFKFKVAIEMVKGDLTIAEIIPIALNNLI